MILYTPMTYEEVFGQYEEKNIERSYITHQGKMFYVDKHPNGEYRLAQLISSNPEDYLNEDFQPGSQIF
jgi:hypothetical protein